MPQLDLFTIQSQIICLFISLFFTYNFLLKYGLSSFDAFSRLKIKKMNFFKTQNFVLNFYSLNLKKKTIEYAQVLFEIFFDISKIYLNKIRNNYKIWYKEIIILKIIKNILNSKKLKKKIFKLKFKLYFYNKLKELGFEKRQTKITIIHKLDYKILFEKKINKLNLIKIRFIKKYINFYIILLREKINKRNIIKLINTKV
jgi:hypothetical protein